VENTFCFIIIKHDSRHARIVVLLWVISELALSWDRLEEYAYLLINHLVSDLIIRLLEIGEGGRG
jgi:hypothetical protein